jgi:glycine/serine hydroxymethyltransferase
VSVTRDEVGLRPELVSERSLADLVWRIRREDDRNTTAVNLVPSENRPSPLARSVMGLDFANRYFFNETLAEDFWHYRGGEGVGDVETVVTKPALSRLAAADHVNVRPVSGMSAMTIALLGLAERPGSAVVCVDESTGGHYATRSLIERLGRVAVPVRVDRGRVNRDDLRRALLEHDVALVYVDLQNSLWELDVAGVVAEVREHRETARVHVDCSHTMGLVLGGAHRNPLDQGADSMGGSTHKSFPGPHKGVLMTRDARVAEQLQRAQFHLISTHHFAHTLALGLAAAEFEHFGAEYAHQVVTNARALGKALGEKGFDVVSHGDGVTDTHQVWLRFDDPAEPQRISTDLASAGVRVNVLPGLPGVPATAMRLGLGELTFAGARENAVWHLADAFVHARAGKPDVATAVRHEVSELLGTPFHFEAGLFGHG